MPTPKDWFLQDPKRVGEHNQLIGSPITQVSLNTALLEYQRLLSKERFNLNDAAANFFRLVGAQEFVEIFRQLGQPRPEIRVSAIRDNLDHHV